MRRFDILKKLVCAVVLLSFVNGCTRTFLTIQPDDYTKIKMKESKFISASAALDTINKKIALTELKENDWEIKQKYTEDEKTFDFFTYLSMSTLWPFLGTLTAYTLLPASLLSFNSDDIMGSLYIITYPVSALFADPPKGFVRQHGDFPYSAYVNAGPTEIVEKVESRTIKENVFLNAGSLIAVGNGKDERDIGRTNTEGAVLMRPEVLNTLCPETQDSCRLSVSYQRQDKGETIRAGEVLINSDLITWARQNSVPPVLVIESASIVEDRFNDGVIDAREKGEMIVLAQNKGSGMAYGLVPVIKGPDGVSFGEIQDVESVAPGGSAKFTIPFKAAEDIQTGNGSFIVYVKDRYGRESRAFTREVRTLGMVTPVLTVRDVRVDNVKIWDDPEMNYAANVLNDSIHELSFTVVNTSTDQKSIGFSPKAVIKIPELGLEKTFDLGEQISPAASVNRKLSFEVPYDPTFSNESLSLIIITSELYGKGSETATYSVPVRSRKPKLVIADFLLRSVYSDGDKIIDAGETYIPEVTLKNQGDIAAKDLTLSITMEGTKYSYRTELDVLHPGESRVISGDQFMIGNTELMYMEAEKVIPEIVLSTPHFGGKVGLKKAMAGYSVRHFAGEVGTVLGAQKFSPDKAAQTEDVDIVPPAYARENASRYGLIIGVEEYRAASGIENAPYTVNDALLMKKYFANIFGIPANQIFTLFNEDATKTGIYQKVDLISNQAKGKDIFFFYAGHGLSTSDNDQLIVPYDADLYYREKTTLSLARDIFKRFTDSGANRIYAFVDACKIKTNTNTRMIELFVPPAEIQKVAAFYGADIGEESHPLMEKGHGLFTYGLLQAMLQCVNDKEISVHSLDERIKENCNLLSLRNNIKQTPTLKTFDRDVVIVRKN